MARFFLLPTENKNLLEVHKINEWMPQAYPGGTVLFTGIELVKESGRWVLKCNKYSDYALKNRHLDGQVANSLMEALTILNKNDNQIKAEKLAA